MTLDPRPTDAQLLAKAHARGGHNAVDRLALQQARRQSAEARPPLLPQRLPVHPGVRITHNALEHTIAAEQTDPALSAVTRLEYWAGGNELTLEIQVAPRTKKNSREMRFSKKQQMLVPAPSTAYETYKAAVVAALSLVGAAITLPLPDRPYNLRATFYVDGFGKNADLDGLLAAAMDALQAAGVLTDDWWVRGFDRSRVVELPKRTGIPRVALVLSPLPEYPSP